MIQTKGDLDNTTILNDQTISKYTVKSAVDIKSLEIQSVLTNLITSLRLQIPKICS